MPLDVAQTGQVSFEYEITQKSFFVPIPVANHLAAWRLGAVNDLCLWEEGAFVSAGRVRYTAEDDSTRRQKKGSGIV